MISSCTSMGNTLYKITSMSRIRSISDHNSPSASFSPSETQRKISYSNTINSNFSSIVDLMKQSKLKNDSRIHINKSYYFNLLKIKLKKKYTQNNFPPIKTFSPSQINPSINYNTMHTLTNTNFLKEKYIKTFSYENKRHKEKKKTLYNNIFKTNPYNLKIVYVNKFLRAKDKKNETEENNEIDEKIKVKNKIEDNKYNLNKSKIRFMINHGFNKNTNNKAHRHNTTDKYKFDKYGGLNNKKIRQFFLKTRLIKVNNKMKLVRKNVEDTKSKINNLYNYLNKDIQYNLDEEFQKT